MPLKINGNGPSQSFTKSKRRSLIKSQRKTDTPSDRWQNQLQKMINLKTPNQTQINHRMGALWKPQVVLNGSTVEKLGNGVSSKITTLRTSPYHLLYHHPVVAGSGGEGTSWEGGEGGGRSKNNWVGNSDEPLHPPFPNGNDSHDSSSSSYSHNDPKRWRDLAKLLPLPLPGSITCNRCVPGRSPGQKYEKRQTVMMLPKWSTVIHRTTPSHIESGSTESKTT